MTAFFWRNCITVTALIAAVLSVLVTLSTIQFDAILSTFVHGRLSVLAQTVEAPFKSATDLGLPLASVRNAQAILERARQTDPDISAVHVFDRSGKIIHSTDRNHSTSVRAEALFAQTRADGRLWYAETGDEFLSGVTIFDGASAPLGGILVVYPKIEFDAAWGAMAAKLSVYLVLTLCAVSMVGLLILRLGLGSLIHVFTGIDDAFSTLERRAWRRLALGSDLSPRPVKGFGVDTEELERLLSAAEDRYVEAGKELAALEAEAQSEGGKAREGDA
ncbi:MAG TPA: PDC sensor domain-containing protein [Pelomicrobium sp.]|nr:PDC sensor domain-containing protein [Pelomicrobium sp.]